MPREFALLTALASLAALPAIAFAQQQPPPPVWPDPPSAQQQQQTAPTAAQKPAAKKPRKKPAAQQSAPDPRLDEEPPADAAAAPAAPKTAAKPAAALNVRCDGPFARDGSHEKLAKAYGAKNVAGGTSGATVLFPNDPKRRLEVTWRDAAGRSRPASIVIEAPSTWAARGFRVGEPLAKVEKTNGKPFRLAGFEGEAGGAARDWQGGALDKLSGGCLLGMRFAADPKAPADARGKVAGSGEFVSDSPEVRAVKPTIVELIVGYPE